MSPQWKPLSVWDDLPVGTWLVKVKKDRKPYNVAEVSLNATGNKMIVVGNYFSWDMGDPIAYTSFEKYEENEN